MEDKDGYPKVDGESKELAWIGKNGLELGEDLGNNAIHRRYTPD